MRYTTSSCSCVAHKAEHGIWIFILLIRVVEKVKGWWLIGWQLPKILVILFFRNVCRSWLEREMKKKWRACSGNHHHILFVASKDWGRACYARRTHNHHHKPKASISSISLYPHHGQKKNPEKKNTTKTVEFTILIILIPRVTTWSHLVNPLCGSSGTLNVTF